MEKVMKLEKQALSAATAYHNQQLKIKELKGKLKKNTNPDFEALQKELSEKTKELEVCHTMIEVWGFALVFLYSSKLTKIFFSRDLWRSSMVKSRLWLGKGTERLILQSKNMPN